MKGLIKIQLSICALFTVLYVLATLEGNRNGQDSKLYKGTAANIYYHHQIRDADNDPLLYHAPLYPLILSIGVPFLPVYIWLLHLFSAWGVFFLWLAIAQCYLRSEKLLWLFGFALALSTPILMIAVLVWSEMVFLLLLSAHLYLLNCFLLQRKEKWLYWAAFLGFFLLLQRNAGIFLFAGIWVGLLIICLSHTSWFRVSALVWFTGISLAGFAYWNALHIVLQHNPQVVTELLPYVDFYRNFRLVFGELGTNFLPSTLAEWSRIGIVVLLLGAITYTVSTEGRQFPLLIVLLTTLAVYILVWMVIPAYENNIGRFLAVVLPVFYLLIFVAGQSVQVQASRFKQQPMRIAVLLFLVYNLARVLVNAFNWGGLV